MKIKKILFVFSSVILLFPAVVCAGNIGNNTYGVFTETFQGASYDTSVPDDYVHMFNFTNGAQITVAINTVYAASTTIPTPEGMKFIESYPHPESTSSWSGWGIAFTTTADAAIQRDMSAYYNGKLKFSIRSTSPAVSKDATVRIKIKDERSGATGYIDAARTLSSMGYQENTNWQELEFDLSGTVNGYKNGLLVGNVPINAAALAETEYLFMFVYTSAVSSDVKVDVDNIRWKKQSIPTLEVGMKDREGADYTGDLSFDAVRGLTKWQVADQYFKILLNDFPTSSAAWIQIYTDNTNALADPRYTGTIDADNSPSGLVDESTTTVVLPMCWRVNPREPLSSEELVIYQNGGILTNTPGGGYKCYLWMQDLATVGFDPVTSTYARIWKHGTDAETDTENGRGVQYEEAKFGAYATSLEDGRTPMFPVYLYIGADFSSSTKVLRNHSYSTNMLTIELIYE